MAVPSSGQLRLRADINQEINGNDTDTNVSLGTLSNDAGFGEPDTMSEFYGYSSLTDPIVSYTSQSSNYTEVTLNYAIDWGGHTSGTYKIDVEIYGSANRGTNFLETETPYSQSGTAPSGTQNLSFTITPPFDTSGQYAAQDVDYRVKVKATNENGTTTGAGNSGGYRSVSLSTPSYYTFKTADQSSYRGWQPENNYGQISTSKLVAGSYFRDSMNHPQLGYFTTHQTTLTAGSVDYTGAVYVASVNYNSSYNSYYTIADRTTAGNGVYHRNIYPDSVSSGSRPNRKMQFYWDMNNVYSYGGVNTFGTKHSNHSMTKVYPDYDAYSTTYSLTNSSMPINGYYGQSGTTNSYNGKQMTLYTTSGGSFSGDLVITITFS
jgi:hypothetical protein